MSKFFKALEQAEQERALRAGSPLPPPQVSPRDGLRPLPPEPPLDSSPHKTERATQTTTIPPVERAPELPGDRQDQVEDHLVSLLAPASFEAEQYRGLRHRVEEWHRSAGLHIVGVSSPSVGDGKTTTAINLAGALAQAPDARVLLIDADLREPAVHLFRTHTTTRLGRDDSGGRGLVQAILHPTVSLQDVVRYYPTFNLAVLQAGRRPATPSPYELLESPRLGELLDEARHQYDYIVVDTPPVVPVPDSRVIAKRVDGFLMVVAAHKTPRKLLEEALNLMDADKIIGLVFNGDNRPLSGYYGYYYAPLRSSNGQRASWWQRAVTFFPRLGWPPQGRAR